MTKNDKVAANVLMSRRCSVRDRAHWHGFVMMDVLSVVVWWRWRSTVRPWDQVDGLIHHHADTPLLTTSARAYFASFQWKCLHPGSHSLNKDDMMYQGRRTEQINSQSSQCITEAGHCGLALYSQMMGERLLSRAFLSHGFWHPC